MKVLLSITALCTQWNSHTLNVIQKTTITSQLRKSKSFSKFYQLKLDHVPGSPKKFWGVVFYKLVGGNANLCVESVQARP